MDEKYFLVRVKRTNGVIEKGVEVRESLDDAKQGYHAYMAAYAYGRSEGTDYVMTRVLNGKGLGMDGETWEAQTEETE